VEKREKSGRFRRAALTLLGIFVCLDAGLGFYHLTHGGGWVSGSIELTFAVIIGLAGYLIFYNRQKADSGRNARLSRRTGMAIILFVSAIVFILSIYHFTHQGLPSGIIELVMTVMLVSILLIVSKIT
jgi:hypothetical protein